MLNNIIPISHLPLWQLFAFSDMCRKSKQVNVGPLDQKSVQEIDFKIVIATIANIKVEFC